MTIERSGSSALSRQIGPAHQVTVDGMCGLATFADGPHYERLSAADVAGGEQPVAALHAVVALGGVKPLEASTRHDLQAQLLHHIVLGRAGEAHREQYEVGRHLA